MPSASQIPFKNVNQFSNVKYKRMCEQFNNEVSKTAAERLWSNGLCERYNGVIKESVKKVVEDVKCSLETASAWAVSAKTRCIQIIDIVQIRLSQEEIQICPVFSKINFQLCNQEK